MFDMFHSEIRLMSLDRGWKSSSRIWYKRFAIPSNEMELKTQRFKRSKRCKTRKKPSFESQEFIFDVLLQKFNVFVCPRLQPSDNFLVSCDDDFGSNSEFQTNNEDREIYKSYGTVM